MRRRTPFEVLRTVLFAALVLSLLPEFNVHAQAPRPARQEATLTAQQAATRAVAKHGGRVLKVTRQGNAYRVKLLQESGRVMTVTIRD